MGVGACMLVYVQVHVGTQECVCASVLRNAEVFVLYSGRGIWGMGWVDFIMIRRGLGAIICIRHRRNNITKVLEMLSQCHLGGFLFPVI